MQESFPELGIIIDDSIEMSWIESILYAYGIPPWMCCSTGLLRPMQISKWNLIMSSNLFPEIVFNEIHTGKVFSDDNIEEPTMTFINPYGGEINEVSQLHIYKIIHLVTWSEETASDGHLAWIDGRLHNYMTPCVSKNPRKAHMSIIEILTWE